MALRASIARFLTHLGARISASQAGFVGLPTCDLTRCLSFGPPRPDFDVEIDRIEDCENACKADTKCAAWTYVKPGYEGPQATCYLKSAVPGVVRVRFREDCRSAW
jgi:PAN domain